MFFFTIFCRTIFKNISMSLDWFGSGFGPNFPVLSRPGPSITGQSDLEYSNFWSPVRSAPNRSHMHHLVIISHENGRHHNILDMSHSLLLTHLDHRLCWLYITNNFFVFVFSLYSSGFLSCNFYFFKSPTALVNLIMLNQNFLIWLQRSFILVFHQSF